MAAILFFFCPDIRHCVGTLLFSYRISGVPCSESNGLWPRFHVYLGFFDGDRQVHGGRNSQDSVTLLLFIHETFPPSPPLAALPPRHQRHPLPAARPGPPRPDARAQIVRASQAGGGGRCGDEWKRPACTLSFLMVYLFMLLPFSLYSPPLEAGKLLQGIPGPLPEDLTLSGA